MYQRVNQIWVNISDFFQLKLKLLYLYEADMRVNKINSLAAKNIMEYICGK